MTPYRIKKHRKRGHHVSHMALVPFIDMLMMLVVFLLLHSSDVEILPNTKQITIPQSVAELKPRETVVVMVTKEDLMVNGRSIAKVADLIGNDAQLVIEPLRAALAGTERSIRACAPPRNKTSPSAKSRSWVTRARRSPCSSASWPPRPPPNYGKVSLAVIQKEVEAGGGA